MNAQASLHRLSSGFSAKPKLDKVTDMAKQLGIPMTPDLMQLGSNEAISNALVEIAVGMGKTEEEIGAALGWAIRWRMSLHAFLWMNMRLSNIWSILKAY